MNESLWEEMLTTQAGSCKRHEVSGQYATSEHITLRATHNCTHNCSSERNSPTSSPVTGRRLMWQPGVTTEALKKLLCRQNSCQSDKKSCRKHGKFSPKAPEERLRCMSFRTLILNAHISHKYSFSLTYDKR